jgi:hypothetical protein
MSALDVYIETGAKRVFAVAVDWPGWARSGRDEDAAIDALRAYGGRYAAVIGDAAPPVSDDIRVVDRIGGNATTDFGAPGVVPALDEAPISGEELETRLAILHACWAALDRTAASAGGAALTTGPRGGGRDLHEIIAHVLDAERAYARTVGLPPDPEIAPHDLLEEAIRARARGELAEVGPRGGRRWPARYGIRRAAWHVLDHAWEIEDRTP